MEKSFAPSTDKLIASYNFDGNVLDESGYGNHGTNNGASFVSGLRGQALKFDGIDDFVRIPLDINPGVMPQLTITAWVNTERLEGTVISQDNGGYDRTIDIDNRGGGLGWSAFCGSGGVLGYHPVTTGDWVFLAVVYDQASATVRLHVNDSVYQGSGSLDDGLNYLHIGANPSFGTFFTGLIDEVKIYNSALSTQEAKDIYTELSPIAAAINSGQSGSDGSGLVAYYPFDNNFLDNSDYSNNGNEVGNLAFSPGVAGSCVRFDGSSYIEVADSPSLDIFNAFTFSVWLNKEDAGSGGWSVILSKGNTGSLRNESPYALAHSSDGLSPLVRLVQNNKAVNITSGATAGFKNWYHLTVTWDGQYVKFYIDGKLTDTNTWTGYLPNSNSGLLIGCDPPGDTEYYRGYMDELRIYNITLTPGEIEALYYQDKNAVPEPTTPEPGTTVAEPVGPVPTQVITIKGDCDGDGKITANDALAILQAAVGKRDVSPGMDINNDGAVSSVDARMVLRAALGLENL